MLYFSKRYEIKSGDVINHLGYAVRKAIREENNQKKSTILLEYPVVYIHTWKDEKGTHFYVGETIDLARRINEHEKKSEEDDKWQQAWLNAQERVSFFFGSDQMNKSLCLDLENTLIRELSDRQKTNSSIICHNKRENEQYGYNNSCCKSEIIENIWKDLNEFELGELSPHSYEAIIYPMSEDELIPFGMQMESNTTINNIEEKVKETYPDKWQYLLEHPVIYMHCWIGKDNKFCVYTGEANYLLSRTSQHQASETKSVLFYNGEIQEEDDWHSEWRLSPHKVMIVFGHPQFNKSMTLDIENRLIQYNIFHGYAQNGRTNEQGEYNNREKMHGIFCETVGWLVDNLGSRFQTLDYIRDKSSFMASALMDLTAEQKKAQKDIVDKVLSMTDSKTDNHKLFVVTGNPGTGKTVLASKIFFSLLENEERNINSYFLVNHKELFNTYSTQADSWCLTRRNKAKEKLIYLPAKFLTEYRKGNISKPDVLIIDESHLLRENGQGGSKMEATQLKALILASKVTLLMFDPNQFMEKNTYWTGQWDDIKSSFEEYCIKNAIENVDVVCYQLDEQMRMKDCAPSTIEWIESLIYDGGAVENMQLDSEPVIDKEKKAVFIHDKCGYEVGVFCSLKGLAEAIKEKKETGNHPSGLIATFEKDWKYRDGEYISKNLGLQWHNTGKKACMDNNIWTFSEALEVGAYHDIQGFDLKYSGVILGRSISYDSQYGIKFKIEEHQKVPKDKDEDSMSLAKKLISNELRVLLSRGTKGVYIHACDENLRDALLNSIVRK